MKRAAVLLVLLFPLSLFAADGATTVILVRHAERVPGDSQDPELSVAGQARAKALLAVARDAHVNTVFVTQFRRTKDTAAEVVATLGIPVVEITVERGKVAEHADAIAKRILEKHRGQTILVVGHSNTIPAIVKALTGVAAAEIPDDEFSRIYVVVHEAGKPPRVIVARYGA
jgi:broad specificity phosphatase PhoE